MRASRGASFMSQGTEKRQNAPAAISESRRGILRLLFRHLRAASARISAEGLMSLVFAQLPFPYYRPCLRAFVLPVGALGDVPPCNSRIQAFQCWGTKQLHEPADAAGSCWEVSTSREVVSCREASSAALRASFICSICTIRFFLAGVFLAVRAILSSDGSSPLRTSLMSS